MGGIWRVARQPEGDVGLDGGGEVARPSVEGVPGAVLALLATDVQGGGAGGVLVEDAEELTQQQVLGVHGDVGLQVALPPALGVLGGQQVLGGPPGGEGRGLPWAGRPVPGGTGGVVGREDSGRRVGA